MGTHLRDERIDELLEPCEPGSLEEREHLSACSTCRTELALARAVEDALKAVPRLRAPPSFVAAVMASVVAARARRRRAVALASIAGAAALAVILVWLATGGVAAVTLDAIELTRSLGVVARVTAALWNAFPVAFVLGAAAVLLCSGAALRRVVARVSGSAAASPAAQPG